jgi:hypothetical protein
MAFFDHPTHAVAMPSPHIRIVLSLATITALSIACSRGDADANDSAAQADTAAAPAASSPAPTASATPSPPASLTADDIDRWEKGMAAELEAVRKAGEQLKTAKTGNDTLTAMMGSNEMSTRDAGASAAGVDPERYQLIRSTLSSVVGQMAPLEQEMNVSSLPASAVAELKKSRDEGLARATAELSPQLVEALKPRAAALRKQDLTLTGERLKAAGAAR